MIIAHSLRLILNGIERIRKQYTLYYKKLDKLILDGIERDVTFFVKWYDLTDPLILNGVERRSMKLGN